MVEEVFLEEKNNKSGNDKMYRKRIHFVENEVFY